MHLIMHSSAYALVHYITHSSDLHVAALTCCCNCFIDITGLQIIRINIYILFDYGLLRSPKSGVTN